MKKLKRHTLNGSSFEWVLASDVEELEAANAVNEQVISELEKSLRLRVKAHKLDKRGLEKLWLDHYSDLATNFISDWLDKELKK